MHFSLSIWLHFRSFFFSPKHAFYIYRQCWNSWFTIHACLCATRWSTTWKYIFLFLVHPLFFCIHSRQTRASGSIFESRSHTWLCKRSWKFQVHHFERASERDVQWFGLEKNRRIECARLLPNDNCLVFRLQSICLQHKRRYKMFINRISNNEIAHFLGVTHVRRHTMRLACAPATKMKTNRTRTFCLQHTDPYFVPFPTIFPFARFFFLRLFANKSD